MGLAAYVSEACAFLLGIWLFRRLGYKARLYFMAHFDWQIVKKSFRFGIFEMAGSAAYGIGQAVEILITQAHLVNYAEVWGNWVLAQNFVYAFNVISILYGNLMPSISEAISHGRQALSRYYSAVAYQWGGMISAFLAAVLLAVADRFILGASGPEFVRAASYAVPLLLWGAVQYPSWVGDNVQRGANRPYLFAGLVIMEQAIRIGLALVLIQPLQIKGLIIAYFVGIMVKNVLSYLINDRVCFKQRFYFWQSLASPCAGRAYSLCGAQVAGNPDLARRPGLQHHHLFRRDRAHLPAVCLFLRPVRRLGRCDPGRGRQSREPERVHPAVRPPVLGCLQPGRPDQPAPRAFPHGYPPRRAGGGRFADRREGFTARGPGRSKHGCPVRQGSHGLNPYSLQ